MKFKWRYVPDSFIVLDSAHRVCKETAEGRYILEYFYLNAWLMVYVDNDV